MTLLLDSGALIALERNDRLMWRRLKAALQREEIPITHGGVVGQAWRGLGPRSASARFTHPLSDATRPSSTASFAASINSESTVTVNRSLFRIQRC